MKIRELSLHLCVGVFANFSRQPFGINNSCMHLMAQLYLFSLTMAACFTVGFEVQYDSEWNLA